MARSIRIQVELDSDGAVSGIRQIEGGLDEVEGSARDTSQEVTRMGSAFDVAIKGIAILAVAALARQMGSLVRDVVRVGVQFDDTMALVRSVTGATGDEFEALRQQAQELGRTTRFAATEAADAMVLLGRAGFETTEIMQALPDVLNLSAATGTDLATSADIASNVLQGMGLAASDTARVVDVLTAASNSANTSVEQLGQAAGLVAPQAAGLGEDVETLAAAIGVLGDAGIQGSRAGTALRASLQRLNSPVGEGASILEDYNIELQDADGNFVGLTEAIRRIDTGFSDLTDSQRTARLGLIVGQEAAAGFTTLLNRGADGLEEFSNELRLSAGTAEEAAETLEDNLGGATRNLRSALEGAQIALFDTFSGEARDGVEALTGVVRVITQVTEDYAGSLQIAARLIVPLTASTAAYVTVLGAKSVALGGATTAMRALNAAIRANPLGVLIGLATAVVTAYATFADRTDEVTESFREQRQEIDGLIGSLRELEGVQLAQAFRESESAVRQNASALKQVREELEAVEAQIQETRDDPFQDVQLSTLQDRATLRARENQLIEERDELTAERAIAEQDLNDTIDGRIALLRAEQQELANRRGELTGEEEQRLLQLNAEIRELEQERRSRLEDINETLRGGAEATEDTTDELRIAQEVLQGLQTDAAALAGTLSDGFGVGDGEDIVASMQAFLDTVGELPTVTGIAGEAIRNGLDQPLERVNFAIQLLSSRIDTVGSQEQRERLIALRSELTGLQNEMLELGAETRQFDQLSAAAQQFSSQLVGGLLRGQSAAESLSRTLDNVLSQLASSAFASLIGVATGGGGVGILAGLFGSRRTGGPVSSGRLYETHGMGEREFFVPSVDGDIMTRQQLQQGGSQRIDVRVSGTLRGDMGELVAEIDEQRTINGL